MIKKKNFKILSHSFNGEYQVAKQSVVVSPTKMNVLYILGDKMGNPVDISVPGVSKDKPEFKVASLVRLKSLECFITAPAATSPMRSPSSEKRCTRPFMAALNISILDACL